MRRSLKLLLIIASMLYLSMAGYLYYAQRSFIYNPPLPHERLKDISTYDLGKTQDVYLTTTDNVKLHAWYHPPTAPCKTIILFLHGNAELLDARKDKIDKLREMGYGFLLLAWRGYGNSEGEPSKEGIYEDAHTAIKFLQGEGYDLATQVIVLGESLGTGVGAHIATIYQFRGLMLLSPYTSIQDMAQAQYPYMPIKYLLTEDLSTVRYMPNIHTPVLVMHGNRDHIIPYQHSEALIHHVPEPKRLIIYDGVRHVDFDTTKIFTEMEDFFGLTCQRSTK